MTIVQSNEKRKQEMTENVYIGHITTIFFDCVYVLRELFDII